MNKARKGNGSHQRIKPPSTKYPAIVEIYRWQRLKLKRIQISKLAKQTRQHRRCSLQSVAVFVRLFVRSSMNDWRLMIDENNIM
mmetsp:Transcript_13855/g.18086  ORF Transcript_13855/g.18086 Transcript_13855/m.18086 type:complete len:84 (+) Transcript_13855:950-1201(+)